MKGWGTNTASPPRRPWRRSTTTTVAVSPPSSAPPLATPATWTHLRDRFSGPSGPRSTNCLKICACARALPRTADGGATGAATLPTSSTIPSATRATSTRERRSTSPLMDPTSSATAASLPGCRPRRRVPMVAASSMIPREFTWLRRVKSRPSDSPDFLVVPTFFDLFWIARIGLLFSAQFDSKSVKSSIAIIFKIIFNWIDAVYFPPILVWLCFRYWISLLLPLNHVPLGLSLFLDCEEHHPVQPKLEMHVSIFSYWNLVLITSRGILSWC